METAQRADLLQSAAPSVRRSSRFRPEFATLIAFACSLILYSLPIEAKAHPIPYYFISQPLVVFTDSVVPILLLVLSCHEIERLRGKKFQDYLLIIPGCILKQFVNPLIIGALLKHRSLLDIAPTGFSFQLFFEGDVVSWLLLWPIALIYSRVPPRNSDSL